VELGGSGELHAPFLTERRTRGSLQCNVAGNPGPGLASMAIFTMSFLSQLATNKSGYARDEKGEGRASIGFDGSSDNLTDLVHRSLNLPRTNRRSLRCAHPGFRVRSGRDDNSFVNTYLPHNQPSRRSFLPQLAAGKVRWPVVTARG
jgi:hypothetical protein